MNTPLRLAALVAAAAACATALAGCGSSASSTASAQRHRPRRAARVGRGQPGGAPRPPPPLPRDRQGGQRRGHSQELPGADRLAVGPTATEDLYAVGAGSQVVAVDQDSDYPAGVPKTSLSGLTPNIEAIAKYNPSLVIASQDSGGLVAGMAKLGIPVLIEPAAATLAAAYAQIEQVGQATGHAAKAAAVVAGMQQQIAADVKQAGASHQGLTYYWELSANPFYSATSSTFIGQVVGLFGLKNIADKASKPSRRRLPRAVTGVHRHRQAADHLPRGQPGRRRRPDARPSSRKRPGWSGIPAVQQGEVIGLNDDVASRWGPRLPELVGEIAQAVEQASK